MLMIGGRALKKLGPIPGYQTLSNSEYQSMKCGSQSVGDKLHGQKGNTPDHHLRPLNTTKWRRM